MGKGSQWRQQRDIRTFLPFGSKQNSNPPLRRIDLRRFRTRVSTLKSAWMKAYEPKNPPFTEQDRIMKRLICGVDNLNTCFLTGSRHFKKGDHVFEIKGYYKTTHKYGHSSEWNTLPVCAAENCSYKTVKVLGNTRNLGRDILTPAEVDALSPTKRHIYDVIIKWKAYAASRGAFLSFTLPPHVEQGLAEEREKFMAYCDAATARFYRRQRTQEGRTQGAVLKDCRDVYCGHPFG